MDPDVIFEDRIPPLTPADLATFSHLGITADLLNQARIERVTDRAAREEYGIVGYGDMSGVVFPYMDPMTGHRWSARVRRDNPEMEGGKPRNKYISAYGDRRHLYFPPGSAGVAGDAGVSDPDSWLAGSGRSRFVMAVGAGASAPAAACPEGGWLPTGRGTGAAAAAAAPFGWAGPAIRC